MQFTSIRTKFLAFILPVVLIGFLIFFGVSYKMSSDMLNTNAEQIGTGLGRQVSLEVQREFDVNKTHLEILAREQVILSGDRAARLAALQAVKANTGVFSNISYLTADGTGFDYEDRTIDRSNRDYFKKAYQTGKTVVSEPVISAISGKVIVVIAVPVVNNGKVEAVVTGTIGLANFDETLGDMSVYKTGRVLVADESGIVIVDPKKPEYVGKLDLSREESTVKISPVVVSTFKSVLEKNAPAVGHYVASTGEEMTGIFVPIELDGRRWVVVSQVTTDEVLAEANHLLMVLAVLTLVVVIVTTGGIFFISNSFAAKLKRLVESCNLINDGDLRDRPRSILSLDEIGQLADGFVQMRHTLHNLIKSIQTHAVELSNSAEAVTTASHQSAEASTQVADTVTSIAEGASQQAESATSVTNAAAAISDHTATMAERAEEVVAVTHNTIQRVEEGRHSIDEVVSYMEQIKTGSETVDAAISALGKSSEEISHSVEVIASIADQTNLLALNAAIEAARAGEQGRGFAVVAEEVRKLAEESGEFSKRITQTMQSVQSDMERAVEASKRGSEYVGYGLTSVRTADDVFQSISAAIQQLSGGVKGITDGIRQMDEEAHTVRTQIEAVHKITLENASSVQSVSGATQEQSASLEEISAETQGLLNLSEELAAETKKFRL